MEDSAAGFLDLGRGFASDTAHQAPGNDAGTGPGSVGYSGVDANKALNGIDTSGLETLGQ